MTEKKREVMITRSNNVKQLYFKKQYFTQSIRANAVKISLSSNLHSYFVFFFIVFRFQWKE